MHNLINFKNIADSGIILLSPVNILIGRNGSGKTNVIESIELLANLAQGVPLHEITGIGGGGKHEVRGGLHSCIDFGKKYFSLSFTEASIYFDNQSLQMYYGISISSTSSAVPYITREWLRIGQRDFFAPLSPLRFIECNF